MADDGGRGRRLGFQFTADRETQLLTLTVIDKDTGALVATKTLGVGDEARQVARLLRDTDDSADIEDVVRDVFGGDLTWLTDVDVTAPTTAEGILVWSLDRSHSISILHAGDGVQLDVRRTRAADGVEIDHGEAGAEAVWAALRSRSGDDYAAVCEVMGWS